MKNQGTGIRLPRHGNQCSPRPSGESTAPHEIVASLRELKRVLRRDQLVLSPDRISLLKTIELDLRRALPDEVELKVAMADDIPIKPRGKSQDGHFADRQSVRN